MSLQPEQISKEERFNHLLNLMSSPRFLEKSGLGNEIPFYICPFDPEETVDMLTHRQYLVKQLEQKGIPVLEINLYDLCMELLEKRGKREQLFEMEESFSKDELIETLQGVFDPEKNLVPAIAQKIKEASPFRLMFLTGVGEVYPYIRSHNVLNNLQRVAKDIITVMFFPGAYTHTPEKGAALSLFGKLHNDKYYRAFNIYHCETITNEDLTSPGSKK